MLSWFIYTFTRNPASAASLPLQIMKTLWWRYLQHKQEHILSLKYFIIKKMSTMSATDSIGYVHVFIIYTCNTAGKSQYCQKINLGMLKWCFELSWRKGISKLSQYVTFWYISQLKSKSYIIFFFFSENFQVVYHLYFF